MVPSVNETMGVPMGNLVMSAGGPIQVFVMPPAAPAPEVDAAVLGGAAEPAEARVVEEATELDWVDAGDEVHPAIRIVNKQAAMTRVIVAFGIGRDFFIRGTPTS